MIIIEEKIEYKMINTVNKYINIVNIINIIKNYISTYV